MSFQPSDELLSLPRIKQCTCCGDGTASRWPSGVLECDRCGALGDPFLGLMQSRSDFEHAGEPAGEPR